MMRILIYAVLFCGVLCELRPSITKSWNNGFEGDVTVPGEIHNWRVHLRFDPPVNNVEVNVVILC